ncbi:hypothetical protein J6590_061901 [Homalodisca vitripennis]|nr:hypothetical protein J6590_061901 [Homalodisca vitripennis]
MFLTQSLSTLEQPSFLHIILCGAILAHVSEASENYRYRKVVSWDLESCSSGDIERTFADEKTQHERFV